MKTLPNIMDIRDTVEIVVYGKLTVKDVKNIKFYVYENLVIELFIKEAFLE